MKLSFSKPSKKQVLGALGVLLLLGLAAAAGILSQQLLKQTQHTEAPTSSGLPKDIDEVQSLRTNGKEEEAAKKVDELLDNPDNSDGTNYMLYMEKGHAAVDAKKDQLALDSYKKAAEYNENSDVLTLIGEAYYRLNKLADAKTTYLRAIELIPEDHPAKEAIKRDFEQRIKVIDDQAKG